MRIPSEIISGDTVTWNDDATHDTLGNSIASDWTLTYYLRNTKQLTVTATANGTGWTTTITAAQSATLPPGKYYWQASVSKSGQRLTLGTGTLTVMQDLAGLSNTATYDGRTEAEVALAAIDAEIHARLTGGMAEEYTIGNRSLRKTPMKDLIELQSRYKMIVTRERQAQTIAQGLGNPRAVFVRFN
jgi:hypothetical protein